MILYGVPYIAIGVILLIKDYWINYVGSYHFYLIIFICNVVTDSCITVLFFNLAHMHWVLSK